MKKYVKPELFYERYELSQHIADCAWELQSGDGASCNAAADQVKIPGEDLFLLVAENAICDISPEVDERYCYQPGNGGDLVVNNS